jgi:hypothetical protein
MNVEIKFLSDGRDREETDWFTVTHTPGHKTVIISVRHEVYNPRTNELDKTTEQIIISEKGSRQLLLALQKIHF